MRVSPVRYFAYFRKRRPEKSRERLPSLPAGKRSIVHAAAHGAVHSKRSQPLAAIVCQDGDDHAGGAGAVQCAGGLAGGAARRHDIVDEENAALPQPGAGPGKKGTADIVAACRGRLPGLVRGETGPTKPARPARQPQVGSQATGQRLTLVVAARPAPPPMQAARAPLPPLPARADAARHARPTSR